MAKNIKIQQIKTMKAWRMCCQYDGINTSNIYAEFSRNNPHVPEYYRQLEKLLGFLNEGFLL